MTDHYDRKAMATALSEVQTLIDTAAQSTDALVRSNMADLRTAVDFVSDNVSDPVINEMGKPVSQDAYDVLELEFDALRSNVRAMLWELARRTDRDRSDKDMDHDIAHLCTRLSTNEVDLLVAEYLDHKPAQPESGKLDLETAKELIEQWVPSQYSIEFWESDGVLYVASDWDRVTYRTPVLDLAREIQREMQPEPPAETGPSPDAILEEYLTTQYNALSRENVRRTLTTPQRFSGVVAKRYVWAVQHAGTLRPDTAMQRLYLDGAERNRHYDYRDIPASLLNFIDWLQRDKGAAPAPKRALPAKRKHSVDPQDGEVTFMCSISRDGKKVIAKPVGGGPSSRFTVNQNIESIRTKLARRVPGRGTAWRRIVLTDKYGAPFTLPASR